MKQWNFIRGGAGLMLCVILMAGCAKKCPYPMEAAALWFRNMFRSRLIFLIPHRQTVSSAGRGGTLIPAYWEEDNIGIIDLNPF